LYEKTGYQTQKIGPHGPNWGFLWLVFYRYKEGGLYCRHRVRSTEYRLGVLRAHIGSVQGIRFLQTPSTPRPTQILAEKRRGFVRILANDRRKIGHLWADMCGITTGSSDIKQAPDEALIHEFLQLGICQPKGFSPQCLVSSVGFDLEDYFTRLRGSIELSVIVHRPGISRVRCGRRKQ
jgi:hypothetical protein